MSKIKFTTFLLCILILISCRKDKNYIIEVKDGVEIVSNKNIESSPDLQLNLKLISEISLDMLVLPDSIPAIKSFSRAALDHDGNIYISDFRNCVVYKVDRKGNYVFNFYRKGQGPGESIIINDIKVMQDSVYIFGEYGKTSIFTKEGNFIRQYRLFEGKYTYQKIMNSNDTIICYNRNMVPDMEKKKQFTTLCVYQLDEYNLENYSKIFEVNSTEDLNNFNYRVTNEKRQCSFVNGRIYFEDLSSLVYAVDVYDLKGVKIRRIEKKSRRIHCSDKIKKKAHEIDLRNPMVKVVADFEKQIQSMYIDKNENLWIKPAVEGLELDHQYYDIFNSEGVFMKRIKLPLPDSFKWLTFDKNKLIAIDLDNSIVKVFDYDFF
ncbi:MAG: hypothetical protein JXR69_10635 [Candidatus Delongbacteria bacterium]|nr:hypothetical protein [Candidatus Delongbacteria bacterium]